MQYSFSATLTADDAKRHIPHPFHVPSDASKIRIHLSFEPAKIGDVRNMLTLTLFDSAGFRGAGHRGGNSHEVELTVEQASPGYFPGPLPSGEWTVQIDTHMILSDQPCDYRLEISVEQGSDPRATPAESRPPAQFDFVANPAPGWYRGDLHAHTIHSDARWDVPDLVAAAKSYELDFITLTDHNSVSGLWEMEQHAEVGFLTLGGLELTTFWGHAVCLGRHHWVDWRTTRDGNEMAEIAEQIYADDQLFIIAHPKTLGDPVCTGCRWVFTGMMPGPARFVEVWNGLWWGREDRSRARNEEALALWYHWLNQGYRLVATAGTDAHGPGHPALLPGFNVVYARELSERAILDAITAGHLYLSAGPTLRLTANDEHGGTALMGDTFDQTDETASITVNAHWESAPARADLRLIVDGTVFASQTVIPDGAATWTLTAGQYSWFLLELRSEDNEMLAITNPIFAK